MTTIACDGTTMAADGLVTANGTIWGERFAKIIKLPDGRIAGASGSAYFLPPFFAWLENGGDFPELGEDFEGMVLATDGSCRTFDDKGRSIPEELPTASGSGKELALGAMLAGASPRKAIEIAVLRDCGSGGQITVLRRDE